MDFQIKKVDSNGRIGIIKHNNKELITPTLFPVVSPIPDENLITPIEIKREFGFNSIFTNSYIMFKKKEFKDIIIEKGIHNFLNFDGLIATDSGAFQYYMYNIDEDVTAEEIEKYQELIKSDFPVILDQPVQPNDNYNETQKKIEITINRARENITRRINSNCAWIGPIQGCNYIELLIQCVKEMNKLDFSIYAIGGVVKALNDYMFDYSLNAILSTKKLLRPDRPLHLFGAGLPQYFALSVACGIDTMDSAAYILFAKEGRYMTLEGTKYILDLQELPCNCPICSKYTANEIKNLYSIKINNKKKEKDYYLQQKNEGIKLIGKHNLYLCAQELKKIRESIREGSLWELVEQRSIIHPRLLKAYSQLPKFWNYLEQIEPNEKNRALFHFGNLTYNRPIFFRILKNIFNKFYLNKNVILVFLPELDCSIYNSPTLTEWLNYFEKQNKNLMTKVSNSIDKEIIPYEIYIVSNIFTLIPYKLINFYPFSQHVWFEKYTRTNIELETIKRYLFPNSLDINYCENWEFDLFNNYQINSNMIFSREEIDFAYEYFYNRIHLIIKFLEQNEKFIKHIIIVRPEFYITEENYKKKLQTHLIDDIEKILKSNRFSHLKYEKIKQI